MRNYKRIKDSIFVVTILSFLCLLIGIACRDQVTEIQTRTDSGFTEVKNVTETEKVQEDAPAGVRKVYTFLLDTDIPYDTSLAFYTVHQYVTVRINGEMVYSLQPSQGRHISRTVGSNWVMIPLYAEDGGKEVKVEISPVYQSFQNREVAFLVGSPLAIYRNRLARDLPQILLGSIAILMGITFLGVAGYSLLRKHPGKKLAMLGLVSVMLGLWKLCDTRFTPFMDAGQPVLFYYIAIMMLMLVMLPLLQWMKDDFTEKGRRLISGYETGIAVVWLVQFAFQWMKICDLRELMPVTHIMMGIGAVILVCLVAVEWKHKEGRKRVPLQIRLVVLFVAGILADVVSFYIRGNSSGLLFSLMALIVYIMVMGVHTMLAYSRQQVKIAKLDRELAEQEHRLADSRIRVMMSQIRSHFIFNVLATISTYCKIDPKTADKALICFSRYLRRNIHIIEEDGLIGFTSELEQLEDYVTLERLRFAEKITFEKNIETASFQIPPLTVQPIVENAIKHGLIEHGRSGRVFLHTERKGKCVVITVTDDGAGFEPEMLEKTDSVGIRNVRYRLETMAEGTLTVQSEPGKGTVVTIEIPQKEET